MNIKVTVTEEGWFAKVLEFPGCMTQGETLEEVLTNLSEAIHLWVETVDEEALKYWLVDNQIDM